jgi:hypothetical protein
MTFQASSYLPLDSHSLYFHVHDKVPFFYMTCPIINTIIIIRYCYLIKIKISFYLI